MLDRDGEPLGMQAVSSPKINFASQRADHCVSGFIDPFFSSGVHLAIAGAVSATATICGVLRRDWSEEEAIKHFETLLNEDSYFTKVVDRIHDFKQRYWMI